MYCNKYIGENGKIYLQCNNFIDYKLQCNKVFELMSVHLYNTNFIHIKRKTINVYTTEFYLYVWSNETIGFKLFSLKLFYNNGNITIIIIIIMMLIKVFSSFSIYILN